MQTTVAFLVHTLLLVGAAPNSTLPNPAAAFCTSVGGETRIVISHAGEAGLCELDAASIEQWTLFRYASGVGSQAVQVYRSHPVPNGVNTSADTAAYCTQVGGTPSTPPDSRGTPVKICTFADDSAIAQKTLRDGPHGAGHVRLNTVLEQYAQR